MKALTLWQPWASLVAMGAKRWETRSWTTSYRGPLLIHAAGRKPPRSHYTAQPDQPVEISSAAVEAMIEVLGVADFDRLPRGAVVGVAELTDCRRIDARDDVTRLIQAAHPLSFAGARQELMFGDWSLDRAVWRIENTRLVDPPLPTGGRQGLWTPSNGLLFDLGLRKPCPDCRVSPHSAFVQAVVAAMGCTRCAGTGWVA